MTDSGQGLPGGQPAAARSLDPPVRRPLDRLVVTVAIAVLTAAATYAFADTSSALRLAAAGMRTAARIPHGWVTALDVAAGLAVDLALIVITVSAARRRRRSLWTAIAAAVVAALIIGPLTAAGHAYGGRSWAALLGVRDDSFVVPGAVVTAYISALDVKRLGGRAGYAPPLLLALVMTELAQGTLTPVSATVALAAGISVGYAARLVAGVNPARPPLTAVAAALAAQGLPLQHLRRQARTTGLTAYLASMTDGTTLDVIVVDRDRRGFGLAARLWRRFRVPTPALGHPPLTVRGLMERQALALSEAARAGVSAPRVVALLAVGPEAVLIARTRVDGVPIRAVAAPAVLADAFGQLRRLHDFGISHGGLNPDTVRTFAGHAAFGGWTRAEVASGGLLRRLDVVHLLVSAALATDAVTAVDAYRRGYSEASAALLPLVQRSALPADLRAALKAAPHTLGGLRHELAATLPALAAGPAAAEERLERFRARTVFTVVAGTVAGYLLVTQLSRVNPVNTLQQARPGWILTAAAASAATYLGAALSLMAFASVRLRLWRTASVQLASSFLGLVTPAAASHVALNLRYLQRNGMNVPAATAVIGLGQVVGFTVSASLLVIFSALTGHSVGGASFLPSGEILAVLAGSVVVIALLTVIPRVRRVLVDQFLPQLRRAVEPMQQLMTQPRRLLRALGGNLLLTGGYVAALDASLRAVGKPLALPTVVVVFLAGTVVGSAAPTPGGIGAVEAAMTAALTTVAVPTAVALPAVLLFRLVTFWLPVPLGWVAFSVLERRGVV